MNKKIFIKTFGCQMNEYDSNRILDITKNIGYVKSNDQNNADCYVINTCHIRDKAKEKVFHEVGRIKQIYSNKKKPIMVIAGCVAQAENQEMLKREHHCRNRPSIGRQRVINGSSTGRHDGMPECQNDWMAGLELDLAPREERQRRAGSWEGNRKLSPWRNGFGHG